MRGGGTRLFFRGEDSLSERDGSFLCVAFPRARHDDVRETAVARSVLRGRLYIGALAPKWVRHAWCLGLRQSPGDV